MDICSKCWNRELHDESTATIHDIIANEIEAENMHPMPDESKGIEDSGPRILDSGERREFGTGAVRDIQEGKGRCDLMPLDVVGACLVGDGGESDEVLYDISMFQKNGTVTDLFCAIQDFYTNHDTWGNLPDMFLEVSKHFEDGAKKYGDNNWQLGIPTKCYIDSAVRHYLKYLRGDKDEPHDRAFVWNLMCCIWTCEHKPELNTYAGYHTGK